MAAPKLVSAQLNKELTGIGLTFDSALDFGSIPAPSSFSTGTNTQEVTVNEKFVFVSLDGELDVINGVSITYTAPSSGYLKGKNGAKVENFNSLCKEAVFGTTNLSSRPPRAVYFIKDKVYMEYDTILNPFSLPAVYNFKIKNTADGNLAQSVLAEFKANILIITFTLGDLSQYPEVSFEYKIFSSYPPYLEDLNGDIFSYFYMQKIYAKSKSTVPSLSSPKLVSAILNKEKFIIGLTFDKALNTTSAPAPSSFGTNSIINEVKINDRFVTLILNGVVDVSNGITVSYTPSGTNDLKDVFGVKVDPFTTLVQLSAFGSSTDYEPVDIYYSGNKVYLIYDRVMNQAAIPGAFDFAVKINNGVLIGSNAAIINSNIVEITFIQSLPNPGSIYFQYEVYSSIPPFLEDMNGDISNYLFKENIRYGAKPAPIEPDPIINNC